MNVTLIRATVVALVAILLPALLSGQVDDGNPLVPTLQSPLPTSLNTVSNEPIKTTLCDLVKNPELFSGKMVTLRGHIHIAFEDFQLDLSNCGGGRTIENIWLEYGSGPKRQPTTWCCGDIKPRDSLKVEMNRDFRAFDRYLTPQKRGDGCHEGECHLYDVTATLTGRFDLRPTVTCPDRKSQCPKDGGFGHFGIFVARLVIQSVSDVAAKPTDPTVSGKKK